MKVSRNWLQNYFEKPIPEANRLAELFTFHSFEIEGVEDIKNKKGEVVDSVIDAKVLPDRAHYCLSHKGVAGEISVLTGQAMKDLKIPNITEVGPMYKPAIKIQDPKFCKRYMGRFVEIKGSTFAKSPEWMKNLLEAVGQRSISGVVDATNFCMFDIGQPLHAFDADKIKGGIVVRSAKAGEKIVLLDGIEITLTADDSVIADDAGPLAIAGVKGGKRAEVTNSTKRLIIECANFEPTAVRRTSTKYNLRSESSKRYENEITPELASLGMDNVCALIKGMNPEVKFGSIVDVYPTKTKQTVIDFDPAYTEERLGVKVSFDEAKDILKRMGITVDSSSATVSPATSVDFGAVPSPRGTSQTKTLRRGEEEAAAELWKLTIPFNRLDLTIREDIVEEVGRVHGYEHIRGILPPKTDKPVEILLMYYLVEKIRNNLIAQGFSEVSLYTLVEKGDIETAKPLAKDKAFARENLIDGMMACVEKNALNADLLGLQTIKVFEIGKVFGKDGERLALSLGVAQVKKIKGFDASTLIKEALRNISLELNIGAITAVGLKSGPKAMCEIDLEGILKSFKLPDGASYEDLNYAPTSPNHYKKISPYPFIVRDVAVFVPESIQAESVWQAVEKGIEITGAKELLARHSLFDVFKKDGKISYAFRLVFQSADRTLTDDEVNKIMDSIYSEMMEKKWEVR